jgi:hypothetical protein
MRENFIKEIHNSGLAGYFGKDKTIALVEAKYYWLKMKKDMTKYVAWCRMCQIAKGNSLNLRFYMLLSVPSSPWIDLLCPQ